MRLERLKGALLAVLVIASITGLAIPLLSSSPVHAALISHAPIYINGNGNFTPANGVNGGGSGTENDPYIIENWEINAENARGIAVENTTAYFVIRNCLLENVDDYSGIRLYTVANGKVENCTCDNYLNGIYLYASSNNILTNNTCNNNSGEGIYLASSSSNILTNNTCRGSIYDGIYLESASDSNILTNNICDNNNCEGIYFWSSSNNILTGNTCNNNSDCGISLYPSSNNILTNNTCNNNSDCGIILWGSNSTLTNNTCGNNQFGILLVYSSSNNIYNNFWNNNGTGILLSNSENNLIEKNLVENNGGDGILFGSSSTNILTNNTINNDHYNGIEFGSSSNNNTLTNNTIDNNHEDGISFFFSSNNIVTNNTWENNGWAIFLSDGADNNILTGNTCSKNGAGIHFFNSSSNNLVYHNNFISNSTQAYDDSSNYWDDSYPSGGNYWSDYIGMDENHGENQNIAGGEGIGDTPYSISGGINQDHYSLMNPWPATIENYFDIHLSAGWNLVGFVTENTPNSIFTGLTQPDNYLLYYWNAPSGPYELQDSNTACKDNVGYWVWINQDKIVGTSGTRPTSENINLKMGWNLVSFPVVDNITTPENLFAPLVYNTHYLMYYWNTPGGPYSQPDPSKAFKDNLGYWVWIYQDGTLTVPYQHGITPSLVVKNPDALVYDLIAEPESLDPAWAYDTASGEVIQNVYETLISYKDGKTDEFDPRLADNWTISSDGLTYTFRIRAGVKFQNGDDLTPQDVEYSFERAMVQDRDGGPVWMFLEPFIGIGTMSTRDGDGNVVVPFGKIDNAVKVENGLVVFHLKQPYGPFLEILAQSWSSIVDKNWCIAQGDWPGTAETYENFNNPQTPPLQEKMNGTGPFELDRWERGMQVVMMRNDNYWRTPAKLKWVYIKEVDEWTDRKLDLWAGDADFVYVSRANLSEIENVTGIRTIENLQELTCDAIFFNFEINENSEWIGSGKLDGNGIPTDFFTDNNVRLGFAYSFDWDTFIQDAFFGQATQPASPIVEGLPYVDPSAKKYSLDLAKAENYFKQAFGGALWENGFKLTILYNTGNVPRRIAAEIFKQNIENINPKFSIVIEARDWPTYLRGMVTGNLTMYYLGWQADFADPHNFVSAFMASGGALSAFQSYNNPLVDNLINSGVVETDPAQRQAIYYELQQIYYEDVPSLPTAQVLGVHVERDWVNGWYYNPIIPGTPWGGDYYPIWKGY